CHRGGRRAQPNGRLRRWKRVSFQEWLLFEVDELSFHLTMRGDGFDGEPQLAFWRPACRRSYMDGESIYVIDRALMPVSGEDVFHAKLAQSVKLACAPGIVQNPVRFGIGRGLRGRAVGGNVLQGNHRPVKMQGVKPRQHLVGSSLVL